MLLVVSESRKMIFNRKKSTCFRKPTKLKGKFSGTGLRPTMLYGFEFGVVKKQHYQKMSVTDVGLLRWMSI